MWQFCFRGSFLLASIVHGQIIRQEAVTIARTAMVSSFYVVILVSKIHEVGCSADAICR